MFSIFPVITDTGMTLLLRAAGGEQITFTKFQAGSGTMAEGESMKTMTALKNVVLDDIPITKAEDTEESGYIELSAKFNNQTDVQNEFRWTELGLIAEDEDGVEYLYAYGYDDIYADRIPAGGDTTLEQTITAIIAIGESENITVNVIPESSYASRDEFLAHKNAVNNPHSVTLAQVGAAAASHNHSADNVTSGTLAVARGGTGVTSLAALKAALQALGDDSVVFGTFRGDGSNRKNITLGFEPAWVMVMFVNAGGMMSSGTTMAWYFEPEKNVYGAWLDYDTYHDCDADTLFGIGYGGCAVTSTGFAVGYYLDNNQGRKIQVNQNGATHFYIAGRS